MEAFGRSYILNVSKSEEFISNDHLVEYRDDSGVTRLEFHTPSFADCHHTGSLIEVSDEEGGGRGWVAVSNCRGLVSTGH